MYGKMLEDGRSLGDILRAIWNTPIGNGLPTPSVLLQGRQLRTTLVHQTRDATSATSRHVISQEDSRRARGKASLLRPGRKLRGNSLAARGER